MVDYTGAAGVRCHDRSDSLFRIGAQAGVNPNNKTTASVSAKHYANDSFLSTSDKKGSERERDSEGKWGSDREREKKIFLVCLKTEYRETGPHLLPTRGLSQYCPHVLGSNGRGGASRRLHCCITSHCTQDYPVGLLRLAKRVRMQIKCSFMSVLYYS